MEDVYGGTFRLFGKVLKRLGHLQRRGRSDLDRVEGAMTDDTKMVWLESPTNRSCASSTSTP
jgi:cystathionine gamma-synthase